MSVPITTYAVCVQDRHSPLQSIGLKRIAGVYRVEIMIIIVLVRRVFHIDARVGFPLLWSTDLEWAALRLVSAVSQGEQMFDSMLVLA